VTVQVSHNLCYPQVVNNAADADKHFDAAIPAQAKMLQKEKLTRCECASHHDILGFHSYDHAYFLESFVSKKEHWPKVCFACEKPFSTEDKDGCCKVDAKHPVHACPWAMDGSKECFKAICTPCIADTSCSKRSKRARRQTDTLLPGEKLGRDGNVVQAN